MERLEHVQTWEQSDVAGEWDETFGTWTMGPQEGWSVNVGRRTWLTPKWRLKRGTVASATATDNDDTAADALQQATATGSDLLLLLQRTSTKRAETRACISDGDGQRRHGG